MRSPRRARWLSSSTGVTRSRDARFPLPGEGKHQLHQPARCRTSHPKPASSGLLRIAYLYPSYFTGCVTHKADIRIISNISAVRMRKGGVMVKNYRAGIFVVATSTARSEVVAAGCRDQGRPRPTTAPSALVRIRPARITTRSRFVPLGPRRTPPASRPRPLCRFNRHSGGCRYRRHPWHPPRQTQLFIARSG